MEKIIWDSGINDSYMRSTIVEDNSTIFLHITAYDVGTKEIEAQSSMELSHEKLVSLNKSLGRYIIDKLCDGEYTEDRLGLRSKSKCV